MPPVRLPDADAVGFEFGALDILDAAADGILSVDGAGHIRFANASASALLGLRAGDLVGQPVYAYIQPADGMCGGNLPARGEQLCWREDGTNFAIEYEVRPIEVKGRAAASVVTFRDITERRAADRQKDELISIASHELRSPLTSIRGALGLLASGDVVKLGGTGQRLVDIAVTSTDRLIRLVTDVLDLERLDSGQISMHATTFDAAHLMRQAVDAVGLLAQAGSVTIEVGHSTAQVWCDLDRLTQVLVNLLANAIKFSSPGSTVWVEAEASDLEIVFSVRDQGTGIPAEKLEIMFDRFVQVHEPGTHGSGGTGLGLAISRTIVTRHGGQIWAESVLGAGTTMYVALPCGAVTSPIADEAADEGALDAAA